MQVFRSAKSGKSYLQIKVRNLAKSTVDSFACEIEVGYEDGSSQGFSRQYTSRAGSSTVDLPSFAEETFGPTELTLSTTYSPASVQVTLNTVTLHDGTTWTSDESAVTTPKLTKLQLSKASMAERASQLKEEGKAGHPSSLASLHPEALQYQHVQGDCWWICSCGAPNLDRPTCWHCGVALDELDHLEDEKALATDAENRKTKTQTRRKKMTRIGIIAAASVAVVAALLFVVMPSIKNSHARSLIEEGNYEQAYSEATSDDLQYKALGKLVGEGQYNTAYGLTVEKEDQKQAAAILMTIMTYQYDDKWVESYLSDLGINVSSAHVQHATPNHLYYDEDTNEGIVDITCSYVYQLTFVGHSGSLSFPLYTSSETGTDDFIIYLEFNNSGKLTDYTNSDTLDLDATVGTKSSDGSLSKNIKDNERVANLLGGTDTEIDSSFTSNARALFASS